MTLFFVDTISLLCISIYLLSNSAFDIYFTVVYNCLWKYVLMSTIDYQKFVLLMWAPIVCLFVFGSEIMQALEVKTDIWLEYQNSGSFWVVFKHRFPYFIIIRSVLLVAGERNIPVSLHTHMSTPSLLSVTP